MDSTQELVRSYLGGMKSSKHSYMETDDEYDLDSLADPLDDISDTDMRIPDLSSPPTPMESPLKAHINKLRGSPVKTSGKRSKPQGLMGTDRNEIPTSPFSLKEFDDLGTQKVYDPEFAPSAKEFERYRLLLASSTDKLLKQLRSEQARSSMLQSQLDTLANDKFKAKVTESDYAILQKEFLELKEKNAAMESELRSLKVNNKEDQLRKEVGLLRQKLMKYKHLYDEEVSKISRAKLGDTVDNKNLAEHERMHILSGSQKLERSVNCNDDFAENLNRKTSIHPYEDFLNKKQSELPNAINPTQGSSKYFEANKPKKHEEPFKPAQSTDNGNNERNISSKTLDPLQDYGLHLTQLTQYLSAIGEQMRQVNENLNRSSDRRENECVCERHNVSPQAKQCSACSAVEGKINSNRPESESTPVEGGDTQALMGKYMWNRTI